MWTFCLFLYVVCVLFCLFLRFCWILPLKNWNEAPPDKLNPEINNPSLPMNMAAKENVNSRQFDTESVVNRWVVDYYLFLALELFKKEQYEDFCAITDVLDSK